MMGKAARRDEKLFYTGFSLEGRVPEGHPLRLIDAAVDFGFVRDEVAQLYGRNGNPSIDPALLLRLMFLLVYENVRSERELMRQLPMRLDWLWFCRLDLDSPVPDHSVLSKARRRWGRKVFEEVFTRVLQLCDDAGLVGGETAHGDSTLLKASANKDGRVSRRLWEQLERGLEQEGDCGEEAAHDDQGPGGSPAGGGSRPASPPRSARATLNNRLVSPTDPDAATHTRKSVGTVLGYRDHRLVDDLRGVILATHATPADGDDGAQLPVLLDAMERALGRGPQELVGDSQYGTASNYELCERKGIRGYLKKRRGKDSPKTSWLNRLPPGCTRERALQLMGRRRTVAEGSFADAHERHGHRRCRWRRKWRVQIGCYLMATVQNVKKLIKASNRREAASGAAVQLYRPATLLARGVRVAQATAGRVALALHRRIQFTATALVDALGHTQRPSLDLN